MERAVVLGRLVAHEQSWVRLSRQRKSSEHPPGLAFPRALSRAGSAHLQLQ